MEPKLLESLWNICEKNFRGIITNMAMAMDISQPTLTRILKGQTKHPDVKTMEAIHKITGWKETENDPLPPDEVELLQNYRLLRGAGHGEEVLAHARWLLFENNIKPVNREREREQKNQVK